MANTLTSSYLVINGVQMPNLKENGLTITKEKIWSSNTGRGADGLLLGDIVATKYKLVCEWPPLTRQEVVRIDNAISPKFFQVKFLDPGTNQFITKQMYAGTPSYPVYQYKDGVKTYSATKVDLIEV